jgi:hypothetical protein
LQQATTLLKSHPHRKARGKPDRPCGECKQGRISPPLFVNVLGPTRVRPTWECKPARLVEVVDRRYAEGVFAIREAVVGLIVKACCVRRAQCKGICQRHVQSQVIGQCCRKVRVDDVCVVGDIHSVCQRRVKVGRDGCRSFVNCCTTDDFRCAVAWSFLNGPLCVVAVEDAVTYTNTGKMSCVYSPAVVVCLSMDTSVWP